MIKRPLTAVEEMKLNEQRSFIEQLLASDAPEHHTAAEKLSLLKLLFEKKSFRPDQKYELDCMGVLLGDALRQVQGLEWVVEESEGDPEFAVSFPDTMIFCFPLSVIRKRVESGEDIDVFYLFAGIAESMMSSLRSGEYQKG